MYPTGQTFRGLSTRRREMRLRAGFGLAVLAAMACGPAGQSQSNSSGSGSYGSGQGSMRDATPRSQLGMTSSPFDDMDSATLQRHLVALNAERQKEMVSDTNKLLKLARELNEEVAASHATAFTPDQIRKIAEIEKLAKSVRERMTSAVGPQEQTPSFGSPFVINPNGR